MSLNLRDTRSFLWLYNPSIDTGSPGEACRGIKLVLDVDHKTAYAPSLPAQALLERCGKNPLEAAGDYLRQLIRQVEKLIESRLGVAIEDTSSLRFILTIPAVWSDRVKEATRQALVPEPEAAALYSLPTMQPGVIVVRTLKKVICFIVCAAGGGAVDLIHYIVHSLEPLHQVHTRRICGVKALQYAAGWDLTDTPPCLSSRRGPLFSTSRTESSPASREDSMKIRARFRTTFLFREPWTMTTRGAGPASSSNSQIPACKWNSGPLGNCYTLVNIWSAGSESNPDLVPESIVQGIRRLLHEQYPTYSTPDLLAALQFLLILLIILFFCLGNDPGLEDPTDVQLSLKDRALVSAKLRAIHSLHHLDFVWSVLRGYLILICWELGPLPAPPPRYLWEVGYEEAWKRMFARFLQQWMYGPCLMSEMFAMNGEAPLEPRPERWRAKADEFGMMLMAEGTITLSNRVPDVGNPYTCGRV
ncbi:hypothetical protein BJX68DRAFT_266988 [Aspergillus pseudodeflectus]|uniref:Fungal-specific transcription factor domain-containing protein n=1 Tax=Aspergillus pseudodeflectus TaxID=176178 RepID=A0ABR4KEK1_9EURO